MATSTNTANDTSRFVWKPGDIELETKDMKRISEPQGNKKAEKYYEPRIEQYQGKKHIVVPLVLMATGVHFGSHGPVLHSEEDLAKYPASWNGIPVVVQHPEEDGINVSANSPAIIEQAKVGRIFNAFFDSGKLRAEAWLDEERLSCISPESLACIKKGLPLEVSVGVFTDDEESVGQWNGEDYTAISHNHRPDHLALLPNSKGACSWEDGCGIRANAEMSTEQQTPSAQVMDQNTKQGGNESMTNKDAVKSCCPEKVELLIQSENLNFGEDQREWLEGLEEEQIDMLLEAEDSVADAQSLQEKTSTMQEQIDALQAKVDELTAALKEAKAKVKTNEKPQMNEEQALKVLESHLSDPEKFMELLPAATKRQMEHGLRLHQAYRNDLISKVKDGAPEGIYTDDELTAMEDYDLERLSKLVKSKVDYSPMGFQGVGPANYSPSVEPLLPPGVQAA